MGALDKWRDPRFTFTMEELVADCPFPMTPQQKAEWLEELKARRVTIPAADADQMLDLVSELRTLASCTLPELPLRVSEAMKEAANHLERVASTPKG